MPWAMFSSRAYLRHGSRLGQAAQTQTAVLNWPPCSGNHHLKGKPRHRASERQSVTLEKHRKETRLRGAGRLDGAREGDYAPVVMGTYYTEENTKMDTTTTRKAHTLKGGETINLYGLDYEVLAANPHPDGRRTNLDTHNPSMGYSGGYYRLPLTRTITVGNNVDVKVIR